MNDRHIEDLIDRAIAQEQKLPQGFSQRLEDYIDGLATDRHLGAKTPATDRKELNSRRFVSLRLSLYWLSGIAAMLLLCMGIVKWAATPRPVYPALADTYRNPEEAAKVAAETLTFLSSHLNKGLEEVNKANREWAEVHGILNKYLKE